MKKRPPSPGSNRYYIEKILRYEAENGKGYSSIVLELLLQQLVVMRLRLRLACFVLFAALGILAALGLSSLH